MDYAHKQALNNEASRCTLVSSVIQGVRYCFEASDALTGILNWDEAQNDASTSIIIDIPLILGARLSQERPCLRFVLHEKPHLVFLETHIEVLQIDHLVIEPFPIFLSGTAERLGVRTMIEWRDHVCLLIDPELLSAYHQG